MSLEFTMSQLWSQLNALVIPNNMTPTTAQPFAFGSRRMRLFSDVEAANKPCIILHQPKITPQRQSDHVPGIYTVKANIWIYTDAGMDQAVYPIIVMNTLLQKVLGLLKSNNPTQDTYNIPGTQARLRIDGDDIITDAGDLDGSGLCLIPLKILLPNI